MRKMLILILTLCALVSAQRRQSVAVLPSVAEKNALDPQRLVLLTDKVREIAAKTLPIDGFILLKQDVIVNRIGEEELFRACKEGVCVGELTKKIDADYGARCDIVKLDNSLVLKFELYSVKDEAILETFTDYDVNDFRKMLTLLEERLPAAFRKMILRSSRTAPLLSIKGGIGEVETAVGAALEYGERRYVVNINTNPQGASLSFNGVPVGSCGKSPCRVELPDGDVRVLAAIEQYETADTTVSIKQNHQSVTIGLRPNFGILEIKPAYSEGIGNNSPWSLAINNRTYYSFENRLPPSNYEAKLSHECYEDISFPVGINKGSHEVLDMAKYLKLKMGVLVLSAEADGKPVSEPVFANGKNIGETPFNGLVPVCTRIGIGDDNDRVNVKIVHNQIVRHTHQMPNKRFTYNPNTAASDNSKSAAKRVDYRVAEQSGLWRSSVVGGGVSLMMSNIDPIFKTGGQFSLDFEWFMENARYFSFGLGLDWGWAGIEGADEIKQRVKEEIDGKNSYRPIPIDSVRIWNTFLTTGVFVKLYPVDVFYLSGGFNWGWYGASTWSRKAWGYDGEKLTQDYSLPIILLGTGFVIPIDPNSGSGIFLEAQYHILPTIVRKSNNGSSNNSSSEGYLSINAGFHGGRGKFVGKRYGKGVKL